MNYFETILNLITRNIDPLEKREIFKKIENDSESKDFLKKGKIIWAFMSSKKEMPDYKIEESYRALHHRISSRNIFSKFSLPLKYAAMLILFIGIGSLCYYWGKTKTINTDESMLATRYTSVVADKGQISKVILPDSSVVWLNSDSKLTYDNNFSYQNRNLQLSGQAFLQVRKNKNLPMIVSSGDLQVKVLGTRFDVDAYPDEDMIKVALESGHVELLNSKDPSFNYKLEPGQLAEFKTQTNAVKIGSINVQDYIGWKEGNLMFRDASMREVIRRLERRFNLKIEVTDPKIYNSVFNAKFENEGVKEIFDYIQYSCLISYQLIPSKGPSPTRVILSTKNSI